MKVFDYTKDTPRWNSFAPMRHWDWSFAEGKRDDITLCYGMTLKERQGNKSIFIDLEQPNGWSAPHYVSTLLAREQQFDKILTINPAPPKI